VEIFQDLRTGRFWRHYWTEAFACFGVLSGIIQFLQITFPAWAKLVFEGSGAFVWVTLFSLVWGTVRAWPQPITQHYAQANTRISVVKGNLLKEEHHIVVGMCDTFDVEVPIISKTSMQGQVLDVIYGGDVKRFDSELEAALQGKTVETTLLKDGKTAAYGIGTIASVINSARYIFFLAYTRMNQANEAHATPDGIWKSLLALWAEVSRRGNGDPVSIPVIGGGQARIGSVFPAQDSIRFIAFSFILASRQSRLCGELRIVVQDETYKTLDRLELQSFLSSLRIS
jgi:hypothetical protein